MSRRLVLVVCAALSLAFAGSAAAQSSTPQQSLSQESSNPINDQGSSFDYRSYISRIAPHVAGLELQVLEFADRLQLNNHTQKTITIYGYSGEPYARVLANGTVEVNKRSPAYYLNQNFYGAVSVPASASASASPQWTVVDRTGQFEWHDHRIHWMSPIPPPQVKNKSKRTKIFNWQVPIEVGTQKGAVSGELFWTPTASTGAPVAAIVALIVIALAGLAFVLFVRRRRRERPPGDPGGGSTGASGAPPREAW